MRRGVLLIMGGVVCACVDLAVPAKLAPRPTVEAGSEAVDAPADAARSTVQGTPPLASLDGPTTDGDDDGDAVEASRALRRTGERCLSNVQCGTGHCASGVCCEEACQETCRACDLDGHVGTCTLVPAGTDPGGQCAIEAVSTCGRAGGCDGRGACVLYPAGTMCEAQTCAGSKEQGAGRCDGAGRCVPGGLRDCAPFTCVTGGCATACASYLHCAPGFMCVAGACRN